MLIAPLPRAGSHEAALQVLHLSFKPKGRDERMEVIEVELIHEHLLNLFPVLAVREELRSSTRNELNCDLWPIMPLLNFLTQEPSDLRKFV
eukprot:CAMPEP_0202368750 /NCGR_PEP_ID=MMETSP1127-20130417/704_1 /ASSEMBLY_ACC=CAM_ASM_000462 /TAXON_ID=3047 /ORGANISM="Dunaliella tertiolecta, Strain CCMP1320" /LENGTH=90 /DNA_ID=CAMNT_0048964191 /DNA_START=357 /DNA_END=629 /DNA_ORIENTATION=-